MTGANWVFMDIPRTDAKVSDICIFMESNLECSLFVSVFLRMVATSWFAFVFALVVARECARACVYVFLFACVTVRWCSSLIFIILRLLEILKRMSLCDIYLAYCH